MLTAATLSLMFPTEPAEGCLAWTIVFATFMIHVLQSGFSDSFGLILPAIKETFQSSNTEACLANSLVVFVSLGSSPVSAWLSGRLGHRLTMVAGVLLATVGLLSAGLYIDLTSPGLTNQTSSGILLSQGRAQHPNILVLYLTVGILTGLGFGLTYLPSITIMKLYFTRNLGLALGIAASGTGFGQFLMAPIVNIMLEQYSLSGTLYFFAVIFFLSIFFCFLYRSPPIEKEKLTEDEEPKKDCLGSFTSIIRTPSKLFFVLHALLLNLCIYAVFTFFAERAISFGIDETNASYLLSMMGAANFFSRIISGVIVDRFRHQAFLILFLVHLLNGLNILASQFLQSFTAQALSAIIFGAGFGAKVTFMVVLVSIIEDDITYLLSAIYLCVGAASLLGPTFVGYLVDVSGDYLVGFLVVSGLFLLGASCLPLVLWLHARKIRTLELSPC